MPKTVITQEQASGTKTPPTSVAVDSSPPANLLSAAGTYKSRVLQNVGTVDVYLGSTSGVLVADGLLLPAGAMLEDDVSGDAWYGISSSGTGDIRVLPVV